MGNNCLFSTAVAGGGDNTLVDAHEEGLQPADGYRPATARGRGRGPGRLRKPRARRAAWRRLRKPRAAPRRRATTDTHARPMTTLAVDPPMTLPSSLAEIDSLYMVKAENDALKAERVQHVALIDSLLADHANNRTALVAAAAPPKQTARNTNCFDASESESDDEEGHAEAHESEDTERESQDEEGHAASSAVAATERAQTGRAKPKATAKAGEAAVQSDAGKKAKKRKGKSAYNMYMTSKRAKAKAARKKSGEMFTREDSKEVTKGVKEMWKNITEERKAFYQKRADKANRDSGL